MYPQEHLSDIKNLRQRRKEWREQAHTISADLKETLKHLMLDDKDTFVSVLQFENLEIGTKIYISPGVSFTPISRDLSTWVYESELEANETYGLQHHEVGEDLEVLYGNCVDDYSKKKYLKGERAFWAAGEKHKPGCTVPSLWRITLYINDIANTTPK